MTLSEGCMNQSSESKSERIVLDLSAVVRLNLEAYNSRETLADENIRIYSGDEEPDGR